jgi:hypothetical protein
MFTCLECTAGPLSVFAALSHQLVGQRDEAYALALRRRLLTCITTRCQDDTVTKSDFEASVSNPLECFVYDVCKREGDIAPEAAAAILKEFCAKY